MDLRIAALRGQTRLVYLRDGPRGGDGRAAEECALEFQTVIYEKRDRVATITLNRPQRLNAFDSVMRAELPQVWRDVAADPEVWVAIVTAAGERAFCTGVDVREAAQGGVFEESSNVTEASMEVTAIQAKVWKPVITAVNGICAGGGLHFVADSDIVICSENATFFDPHVDAGQVSALEPIGLTRRMPFEAVMRMVILGGRERLTAERAYQLGLVSEVVPQERLLPRARELAELVLQGSPATIAASKRAVWEGLDYGLHEAYRNGFKYLRAHWSHPDNKEGPQAFAERRKPQWSVR
jgi:enoyl-CoA hydratase/carnithine racemase